MISDLTPNQQLFVAYSQNEVFKTLLSPYIVNTPTVEEIEEEARRMSQVSRKMKREGRNYYDVDLFKWNGIDDPYI